MYWPKIERVMVQKIGTRIGQELSKSWFKKFNGVVAKK